MAGKEVKEVSDNVADGPENANAEAGKDSVGTARAMSLRGGAPWHAAIWNESIQLGVLCGLWYFMNVQCAYAFSRLHSIHHTYKVAAVEYVAFLACLVLLRS